MFKKSYWLLRGLGASDRVTYLGKSKLPDWCFDQPFYYPKST